MKDNERREEYLAKGMTLYKEYRSEMKAFMIRRRQAWKGNPELDQGVAEEQEIRRRYNKKVNALAEEYKDVAEPMENK